MVKTCSGRDLDAVRWFQREQEGPHVSVFDQSQMSPPSTKTSPRFLKQPPPTHTHTTPTPPRNHNHTPETVNTNSTTSRPLRRWQTQSRHREKARWEHSQAGWVEPNSSCSVTETPSQRQEASTQWWTGLMRRVCRYFTAQRINAAVKCLVGKSFKIEELWLLVIWSVLMMIDEGLVTSGNRNCRVCKYPKSCFSTPSTQTGTGVHTWRSVF